MSILLLIVIAIFAWRLIPTKGVKPISIAELKQSLNNRDKVFIDVRTPIEYKARHIPQFKNVPLGSSFSHLPKDKEIVVICQSGMRSANACKQLIKSGYTNVTNVRGGMNQYH